MTDNPAESTHENDDHGAQENPREDTSSQPQIENTPVGSVDKIAPQEDTSENELSVESSVSSEEDANEDVSESTVESPDEQLSKKPTPRESKPQQPKKSVVVRYGLMRQIGEFRHNLPKYLPKGVKVVVRTERGVELGEVVINVGKNDSQQDETPNGCGGCCSGLCVEGNKLDKFIKKCGSSYPFRRNGRVLRIANPQDLIDYRHLTGSAREETKYARDQIKQRKLPMKLVAVEHILGGGRIIFHFTAESRVDFRGMVKDLATEFQRSEERRVGKECRSRWSPYH